MQFRNWIFSRRGRAIILAVGVMMLFATVVLATTWSNHVPPAWDGANQVWKTSGDVVLDPAQNTVCFQTFAVGFNSQNNTVDCTLTPNGPADDYHYACEMPGSAVASAFTVLYNLWAGDATQCPTNDNQTAGPSGSFGPTGPTAITLQTISATSATPANWLGAALLAGFALLAGAFVLRKRSL